MTTEKKTVSRNVWQQRDWETLFVTGVVVVSLLLTLWMVYVSVTDPVPDNRYRIVPAASIMVMVEIWLILTLPVYGRLAYWGMVISIATYLFFAVPFTILNILPAGFAVGTTSGIVASAVCGLLLFRQRDRFFPPAPPAPRRKSGLQIPPTKLNQD